MRWITKGNSRYLQDGAGLQETSNTHLKVTIFTTCHSSISAERWGRVRSITSGWWSNQYARLVNPRKKYISTGIREHLGWWIHGDDVWVQSSLGRGGWVHLHSPSALPMSSIVLLCVLFCIFLWEEWASVFPKFSHSFYWFIEYEGRVMDSLILVIWSQAWVTLDLATGIWPEDS